MANNLTADHKFRLAAQAQFQGAIAEGLKISLESFSHGGQSVHLASALSADAQGSHALQDVGQKRCRLPHLLYCVVHCQLDIVVVLTVLGSTETTLGQSPACCGVTSSGSMGAAS